MRSTEVRERFLRFFEARGHHRLPSASLIPHDDPSLLFTVAGMVPLKAYIAGRKAPPATDLCSCQRCFRGSGLKYDDMASVGDAYHHTFFEMLGNWSIGGYFKDRAIELAWELLTQEFRLDPERLWPSIFPDDAASERIWTETIGIPKERIAKLTDNWWAAGETGPCGYDSEIYWDFGAPCSCGRPACTPQDECGGDRWCEIWNLVFMEFDQQPDGSRPLLPKSTVDTGMGLERMTSVLQNVRNDYDNDLFAPLMEGFRSRAHIPDLELASSERSLRVLSDHVRGASFLVTAGVVPGNEGRGYVLRRLVRRAALHARRVRAEGGLAAGVADLGGTMGDVYPELLEHSRLIERTIHDEEEAFARTIEQGVDRLDSLLQAGRETLDGEDAFRLYDTYGVPLELTVEVAGERGVAVDVDGFHAAMEQQRARSQAGLRRSGFGGEALPPTAFVGYDVLETVASVTAIAGGEALHAGDGGDVALDTSPFYAEGGGQVGDSGVLVWESGAAESSPASSGTAEVLDTQPAAGGETRVHRVRVSSGTLRPGQRVHAAVDAARRGQTARHHSATHLLNQALREVLGGGIVQRGSFVGPDHTTFDFSFPRALTPEEVGEVEHRVNDAIRRDLERSAAQMPLPQARASGAIALLDESYSETVRVIDFGGWSRELCGGTHVRRSGELGAAIIAGESSIGQGIRRITMVVGEAAERRWREVGDALTATARALKAPPGDVPLRVAALQEQARRLGRELEDVQRRAAGGDALQGAAVEDLNGVRLAHALVDGGDLRQVVDRLVAERLQGDGVAVAMSPTNLAVKVGGAALAAGIAANALMSAAVERTGGRGGGSSQLAQGRIGDASKRNDALQCIRDALQQRAA